MEEGSRHAYFGPETSDEEGTPYWMTLKPNDSYLTGADLNKMHHPNHYMDHIGSSKRSRFVIQARSEGVSNIEFFEMNMTTKESVKHVVKIKVAQCGASTAVKKGTEGQLCRGEVKYTGGNVAVVRGQQSLYAFRGDVSGTQFLAGTAPGRALMRMLTKADGMVYEKVAVYPEGKGNCGFSDVTRLEALEGENAYVLQLCKGDTWITPTTRLIDNVSYTGQAIRAEKSVRDNGFAITAIHEGLSMLEVNFNHGDATPMAVYTEVVECN